MSSKAFVSPIHISELFRLLNRHKIDYVLLRNLNDELPSQLKITKDIDILVNPLHKSILIDVLEEDNWLKLIHPWDFGKNFKFLYSMNEFIMFKKNNIHLDICFQLHCRSLNDGEWFPLDEIIQTSCFKNKKHILNKPWLYQLSLEDELIHLITRCIFDKKQFELTYIKRIQFLFKNIDEKLFYSKLEKVFFKYTSNLVQLLINEKYAEIRPNFLTYKDY